MRKLNRPYGGPDDLILVGFVTASLIFGPTSSAQSGVAELLLAAQITLRWRTHDRGGIGSDSKSPPANWHNRAQPPLPRSKSAVAAELPESCNSERQDFYSPVVANVPNLLPTRLVGHPGISTDRCADAVAAIATCVVVNQVDNPSDNQGRAELAPWQ